MTNMRHRLAALFVAFCTFIAILAGCAPSGNIEEITAVSNAEEAPQTVVQPTDKNTEKHSAAKPSISTGFNFGKFSASFLTLQRMYDLAAVPTYDGYNQATHPKILYFPKKWNGYEYWMSVTPYPFGNDDFENPCILVSNDAKSWVTPAGLKNPITGVPSDVKNGAHYSDSHLVKNGEVMEMWYRYNKGNPKTKHPDSSMDYYYRTVSSNGRDWSVPQLMQKSKTGILSLAVNHENNQYQFWYTTSKKQLMHAVSTDGSAWTDLQQCTVELPGGYLPWHQDVIHYKGNYYLLQTGILPKEYSFALFLSKSADGIHFTKGVPFYPSDNPVILHKTWLYRSTVYADGDTLHMMISYRLPQKKWYMASTAVSVQQWNDACNLQKALILPDPVTAKESAEKKTQAKSPQKMVPNVAAKTAVEKNFA
ncbi:glycoside hydrolase family protein [Faecalispora anaeroviscerum]|uniref:hypothetical protein n=1 Tax=Faecalispora anaeroviscerum TaxID=2991836 RepID=UPI0024BA2541|nr:hypothetical protein [Faecalispora anaeroviscerum]